MTLLFLFKSNTTENTFGIYVYAELSFKNYS